MKIDLSTPYSAVRDTLDRESKGALRWYLKNVGGEEKEQKQHDQVSAKMSHKPVGTVEFFNVTEYCPPSGNVWCAYKVLKVISDDGNNQRIDTSAMSYIQYQTNGSAGCFINIASGAEEDDNGDVQLFTSHFFYRYRERMGLEDYEGDIIQKYFADNFEFVYHDRNGQMVTYRKPDDDLLHFMAVCNTGLVLGIVREDHYYECRTFVPHAMIRQEQRQMSQDLFDILEETAQRGYFSDEEEEDDVNKAYLRGYITMAQNERLCELTKLMYKRGYSDEKIEKIARVYVLSCRVLRTNDILSADNDYIIDHLRDFLRVLAKQTSTEMYFVCIAACIADISDRIDRKITIEEAKNRLTEIVKDKEIIKDKQQSGEIMNDMLKNELRKTIKKSGVKNYETLIKTFVKGSVESYFVECEAEYAISRIMALVQTDKDREKYRKANKTWCSFLITTGTSQLFRPVVEQYGQELTCMAVESMIDADALWSPAKNSHLTSKGQDYLDARNKSIEDMKNEIDMMLYNDPDLTRLLPGHHPEAPVSGEPADTDKVAEVDDILDFGTDIEPKGKVEFCSPEVARESCERIEKYAESLMRLTRNLRCFVDDHTQEEHFKAECDSKQREIERLKKALENEKAKAEKKEKERGEAQLLANSRYDEIQKLKKEKEEEIRSKEGIIKRYNDLNDEFAAFKQKAQAVSALPTKRQAPFSKLAKVRGFGTVGNPSRLGEDLIAVLKESPFNIVIDTSK